MPNEPEAKPQETEVGRKQTLDFAASRQRPARGAASRPATGIRVSQRFSTPGVHPFDDMEWTQRTAVIRDDHGNVIFQQDDAEVPAEWSQLATNVVVSKYFYGEVGKPERETSAKQLIHRVARTIADWGRQDNYFASDDDAERFYNELTYLTIHQHGAFNSPTWFNVGLFHQYNITGTQGNYCWDKTKGAIGRASDPYEYPQASACFILSVADDMESIMDLAKSEAMLFKFGSGTGTDLSPIRSAREKLAGGGRPSGPLSFMRVYDQIAAVVKSGGKTRRAAKMQSLKVGHPDILEFIEAKLNEENKARALVAQGYDSSFNGEAYGSVMFQNANFSIRVTDEFMRAVERDGQWETHAVTTGELADTHRARDLMGKIAQGTHVCGDPGVQYDTTINRWHTCPNSGAINASNPCSEYMFLNDSACNLASLNLMKFRRPAGSFDVESFQHAVSIFATAQEILVDHASYPTPRIAENSHMFRPLGLGYANLGGLLMSLGLPYDSDAGRAWAAAITSVMTGQAYRTSSRLAAHLGPFKGYLLNEEPMLGVIGMHRDAVDGIDRDLCPSYLREAAGEVWGKALEEGRQHGFRNAQVTVLAPTGTIGFMMDCDTTGIEPDIALVKYKALAGGGSLKIINQTVPGALKQIGYDDDQIKGIVDYVDQQDTIEGAPGLKDDDLPIFDCAFRPVNGERSIHYLAHLRMMAAVQPFLSGAISKTINVPAEASVDDIHDMYMEGWRMGLKAVAIYRDGSKGIQPVSTGKTVEPAADVPVPRRRRLEDTRNSLTHKFSIQGHEGYLTVGFYQDGSPGELFITMAKEGSTIGGLMDVFGTAISMALQYGVPLEDFVRKFTHSRFEPSGFTKNPDIPIAKSLVDYIFRWLGLNFIPGYREANAPKRDKPAAVEAHKKLTAQDAEAVEEALAAVEQSTKGIDEQFARFQADAPPCDVCGAITVRNGSCYKCYNCGNSMGCS